MPVESWPVQEKGRGGRGAKSGGTEEPGSQKVNQPAASFWVQEDKLFAVIVKPDPDYFDLADKGININCNYRSFCRILFEIR